MSVKAETRSFYEQAVLKAAERVVSSLDEALDLEQLAKLAALSPYHFHRIFRGLLGETPLELHRRLRLERAAFRLLAEETSIVAIAVDAGYDTHEAFTRVFRARYAHSPTEFRQQGRAACPARERALQVEIAARSGIHFVPQCAALNVHFLKGEETMNVEKKQLPAMRLATLHHRGAYNRISEAFARLGEIAGRAGLFTSKPTMLALYYDDPETTAEAELGSDAAVVVAENAKIPEGLAEKRIAAGRFACTTHVGPYEQLGDAWARFMGHWLPASGERMGEGTTFEIYVNNPIEVPKEQLITELYIPLS